MIGALDLMARLAALSDIDWLLRLRNDPATVAASRERRTVELREHAIWFGGVLDDPARLLMIVEDAFGERVATYRLDNVGRDIIELSLTVAPEARGRGFAITVIRLGARHAVYEGADYVTAFVRRDNTASQRAFARAEFEELWSSDTAFAAYRVSASMIAGWECTACARGVAHHTNSLTSIGRAGDRYPIYDIHEEPDGFYGFRTYECDAGDLLLAWDRARRQRLGLPEPDYSVRSTVTVAADCS